MAENENQNAPETEKTNTEENNEKINKEIPKEENSEQKTEENKPEIKEEETKKEEKLNQENNNKEEGKKDNEDKNEDDSQKKLINSIKELPSESIRAKSIILYDLNEDMKSQYFDKYKSEKLSIELKDLDNFINYLNKIREIVNAPSDKKDSILELISDQNKEKYSITENSEEKSEFTPIKLFWYTSIINAKFFEFSEKDKKILEHLIDVKFIPLKYPSFKIEFVFEDNEYLEENVIYKTYHFVENEKDDIKKTEGCKIKWKSEDKNPTIKTVIKHNKKKKEYSTKKVKSFFNIFDDNEKEKNLDKELVEAQFFRNDFLLNMLEYYLNIMEINFSEDEE